MALPLVTRQSLRSADHAGEVMRPMEDTDFEWAAKLMERRRAMDEQFSPVFWKPAKSVRDIHAGVGSGPELIPTFFPPTAPHGSAPDNLTVGASRALPVETPHQQDGAGQANMPIPDS